MTSRARFVSTALGLVGLLAPRSLAQTDKPIYVQYEGFTKNADKTLTVSFGYFNMNDAAVTIQRGERNEFAPAPADRGQPVTFLSGRHRFACVMVLPDGFDGNLRWRVENGGMPSITTARVLDSNYALEPGSATRAIAGLTPATAPRATCLTPQAQPGTGPR